MVKILYMLPFIFCLHQKEEGDCREVIRFTRTNYPKHIQKRNQTVSQELAIADVPNFITHPIPYAGSNILKSNILPRGKYM